MHLVLSGLIFLLSIGPALCQQNFFNVPSSTITEKDHLFIQEQVNIAMNTLLTSNATIDFGLGGGFEVGLNLLNLNYNAGPNAFVLNCDDSSVPLGPSVLLNGQKAIKFGEKLTLSVGSQVGTNIGSTQSKLLYFNFINFASTLPKDIKVTLGGYITNKNYSGDGRGLIMMGLEIPVLKDKLHVVADYIAGDRAISVSVLGVNYFINKTASISLGWQVPKSRKKEDQVVVFELTLTPDDLKKKKTKTN